VTIACFQGKSDSATFAALIVHETSHELSAGFDRVRDPILPSVTQARRKADIDRIR